MLEERFGDGGGLAEVRLKNIKLPGMWTPLSVSEHLYHSLTKRNPLLIFLFITVPIFDICNTDKSDGGLTFDELHTASCQGYISAIGGDLEVIDPSFDLFDTDGDKIITTQEFLAACTGLIKL